MSISKKEIANGKIGRIIQLILYFLDYVFPLKNR